MRAIAAAVMAIAAALAAAGPAWAEICARWAPAQAVGELDPRTINEASGLAVSRRFPGRLYFNNDSGDGPYVYVTDAQGAGARRVTVAGFTPQDVEDMALGACGPRRTCLYLGDIGDNFSRRAEVRFVVLEERERFEGTVTPLRTITARYPEGAQDAESFAIHPNGDLYLVTKPRDLLNRRAGVARIYRLTAAQLAVSDGSVQTFERVGEIDLPYLLYMNGLAGQIATAMDFAPDGSRALILTYQSIVEVGFDFSRGVPATRSWQAADYRVLPITPPLPQAETVAYAPDGLSFYYATESVSGAYTAQAPVPVDIGGRAPLYRQACEAVATPAAAQTAPAAP